MNNKVVIFSRTISVLFRSLIIDVFLLAGNTTEEQKLPLE